MPRIRNQGGEQDRNRFTDIKKRLVVAKGEWLGKEWNGRLGLVDTSYYIERLDK